MPRLTDSCLLLTIDSYGPEHLPPNLRRLSWANTALLVAFGSGKKHFNWCFLSDQDLDTAFQLRDT